MKSNKKFWERITKFGVQMKEINLHKFKFRNYQSMVSQSI